MYRSYLFLAIPVLIAAPVQAQDADIAGAVLRAQPTKYEQPECGIKTGHFRVTSGATYLSTAIRNETNRERLLRDGAASIVTAITENGQDKNPGAWFYLGRIYLYQGDVIGADTALARAETLAPQCKEEIQTMRRLTSLALLTPAGLYAQAEKPDSAILAYRLAVRIYPDGSQAAYTLGSTFEGQEKTDSALAYYRRAANAEGGKERYSLIARSRAASLFAQAGELDSATVYYQAAIAAAEEAKDTETRDRNTLALAIALYNGQRYAQAIPLLRRYAEARPDVSAVKTYLANAFRANGQVDSAEAIMRQLGATTGGGPDTNSAAYLINRGAARFQAKEFDKAAADFSRALEAEPTNRLALKNLAITYYNTKEAQKLADVAGKLVSLEPLSEWARRLQNQGYIWLEDKEHLPGLVKELEALPFAIENVRSSSSGDGMDLAGTVKGLQSSAGAKPVTVVFEFLDGSGAVVAAKEIEITPPAPAAESPLSVSAAGSGIVDWRYHVK
ncbi:MAG: tetratricopeptide repeat protein [Gemmatimonadales bacterium]